MRAKSEYPTRHGDQHLPDGSDPIPEHGISSGLTGLADLVLEGVPSGFWKLNETSGSTAADSSGNGYDAVPPTGVGGIPPTWADATTPYDENSASFATTLMAEINTSFPALTGDVTLEVWAYRAGPSDGGAMLMLNGDPVPSGGSGAGLHWQNSGTVTLFVGKGSGAAGGMNSDGLLADGSWVYFAATRTSHVWRMYVDATVQTTTYDDIGSYSTVAGVTLGNRPPNPSLPSNGQFHGDLSYAAVYPRALTAAEIAQRYLSGSGPSAGAHYVLTADGTGGSYWALVVDASVSATADIDPTKLDTDGNTAHFLRGDGTWQTPGGGAPTGSAGGALDGSYPNPGLAAAVAGAGLAETSDVLSVNVDGSTLEIASDTLRLKDTAVTAASYGDATHVGAFTVDAKGRITAASNVTITGADPATDSKVWMPLVDSDGTVVLDSHGVIPTLITL